MKTLRAFAPYLLSFLLVAGIFFGFSIVTHAQEAAPAAQSRYTLLESVAGFEAKSPAPDFPSYLRGIFGYLIGIAGIAAVVMLVIAGVEYTASGISEARQSEARKRINNVILGLVGTISAYFLLSIINPKLVTFSLDIPPIANNSPTAATRSSASTPESRESAVAAAQDNPGRIVSSTNNVIVRNCVECISLREAGIPVSSSSNNELNGDIALKLGKLTTILTSDWQVSEAHPPIYVHQSTCHSNGLCADVNFATDKNNIDKINNFLAAGKAVGLKPIYEVQTDAQLAAILKAGFIGSVANKDIRVAKGSAPHFHVEN